MRTLLISNDRRPNPNWPKQKRIKMETNKVVRTYWLKQLESHMDVDAARNTTGSRGTNDSLRTWFSSFHLLVLLHLSWVTLKQALLYLIISRWLPEFLGTTSFRVQNQQKKKKKEDELRVLFPMRPVIHFDKPGFSYVCAWHLLPCPEKWGGLIGLGQATCEIPKNPAQTTWTEVEEEWIFLLWWTLLRACYVNRALCWAPPSIQRWLKRTKAIAYDN